MVFMKREYKMLALFAAVLLVAISVMALATREPGSPPMLERWVGFFFLALLVGYLYAWRRGALEWA